MSVRIYCIQLLFSVLAFTQARAETGLDELIQEALRNNPQLRAARHAEAASRTRIRQAAALDPPQAGVEFFQTPLRSFPLPYRDGMETDYSVQQMFPFPGKRGLMGEAAVSYSAMTEQKTYSLERQIIRDIKTAWYELYLSERRLEINRRHQELLKDMLAISSIRYEAGSGSQSDILRAQTELSMLTASALEIEREKQVAQAMLNSLAGKPAAEEIAAPSTIEKDLPPWPVEQFDSLALEERPELKEMRLAISMSRAELALSQRERYPDLMLRLMYKDMKMSGHDYWSTMFGFSIPQAFWSRDRYNARIEENRIGIQRLEEELAGMSNMVTFQVRSAFAKAEAGRKTVEYYRGTVLPQAEQTLQSTIAAYRAGTADFLMLIDAARLRLRVYEDSEMAVMSYMAGQADLELAAGLELSRITADLPHILDKTP